MNSLLRVLMISIFVFASYHLLRDVLQIAGVDNMFANVLHWPHTWCGRYCNYASLPFEITAMIGSGVVLWQNKMSNFGLAALFFPVFMIVGTFLLP